MMIIHCKYIKHNVNIIVIINNRTNEMNEIILLILSFLWYGEYSIKPDSNLSILLYII